MASTTRVTAADVQITGILDMRMNAVTGLETDLRLYPIDAQQGASKKYVDAVRDDIVANLPITADNGTF